MIMSIFLSDKAPVDPPWAGLRPALVTASLISVMHTRVATRSFRRPEAEVMAFDKRMLKDIGLEQSEIGSVLMDGMQREEAALALSCKRSGRAVRGCEAAHRSHRLEPLRMRSATGAQ
jgi:hypothetical protein